MRASSTWCVSWPRDPLGVSALYYPKPPGARGFALHSDTGYLPTEPPELAGAFIAVDDADAENGALERGARQPPLHGYRAARDPDG